MNFLLLKASAHFFKRFTFAAFKIIFLSPSMHLLPRMNVMLDFHLNAVSPAARNMEQVNIAKKILPTVGFEPPTPHGLQITSPPLSPLGYNSLDMRSN